jgi:hypothetical protein
MGPKKRSASKRAALSPDTAYLNSEFANLGVHPSAAESSSQYHIPHSHLEQNVSTMSPLGNLELSSVERAMLLLGSHETEIATSGLVPDLELSGGKFLASSCPGVASRVSWYCQTLPGFLLRKRSW